MKKVVSYFMIFLVLFHFYGCNRNILLDPTLNNNDNTVNLDKPDSILASYIDGDSPTESKSSKIAINFVDNVDKTQQSGSLNYAQSMTESTNGLSGLTLMCEKITTEYSTEYLVYMAETNKKITVSMSYYEGAFFPYVVKVFNNVNNTIMFGYPTAPNDNKFDVKWVNESKEEFMTTGVEFLNSAFNTEAPQNLDEEDKYKIKIIKISTEILNEIIKKTSLVSRSMSHNINPSISMSVSYTNFADFFSSTLLPVTAIFSLAASIFLPGSTVAFLFGLFNQVVSIANSAVTLGKYVNNMRNKENSIEDAPELKDKYDVYVPYLSGTGLESFSVTDPNNDSKLYQAFKLMMNKQNFYIGKWDGKTPAMFVDYNNLNFTGNGKIFKYFHKAVVIKINAPGTSMHGKYTVAGVYYSWDDREPVNGSKAERYREEIWVPNVGLQNNLPRYNDGKRVTCSLMEIYYRNGKRINDKEIYNPDVFYTSYTRFNGDWNINHNGVVTKYWAVPSN